LKGNLVFPDGRKKMGISFPAAFSSSGNDNDAVALVGRAKCR
jgi:hypothetical protein